MALRDLAMATENPWKSFGSNILERCFNAFVLRTATDIETAPVLVLGKLVTSGTGGNTFDFAKQLEKPLQLTDPKENALLWELKVSDVLEELGAANAPVAAASPEGVYHYLVSSEE